MPVSVADFRCPPSSFPSPRAGPPRFLCGWLGAISRRGEGGFPLFAARLMVMELFKSAPLCVPELVLKDDDLRGPRLGPGCGAALRPRLPIMIRSLPNSSAPPLPTLVLFRPRPSPSRHPLILIPSLPNPAPRPLLHPPPSSPFPSAPRAPQSLSGLTSPSSGAAPSRASCPSAPTPTSWPSGTPTRRRRPGGRRGPGCSRRTATWRTC